MKWKKRNLTWETNKGQGDILLVPVSRTNAHASGKADGRDEWFRDKIMG